MLLVFLFAAYRECITKLLLKSNCDDYYSVSQQDFVNVSLIKFNEKVNRSDSSRMDFLGFTKLQLLIIQIVKIKKHQSGSV